MIGFRNNRPLLKLGDFLIAEYGDQWLADALENAARKAGTTLPFKDDLLASVRYYLEHECDLSVMSLSDLYDRIRRMLRDVGLSHLARELNDLTPPITVSVAEIARNVPFWLFFDGELRHYLSRLREQGITHYRFTDKKECVLALQGKKRWNSTSEHLLDELEFLLSRYEEEHGTPH